MSKMGFSVCRTLEYGSLCYTTLSYLKKHKKQEISPTVNLQIKRNKTIKQPKHFEYIQTKYQ